MKLIKTAKNGVSTFISEWNKPGKGNHVSYKEILSLGFGGMGQQFVMQLLGYLGLSAGNMLLGATIGLRPLHLQYMAMVQTVLNLFFFVIRAKIVDNTRTKWGRFRPYIAIMGFPLAIMASIFIFLPFERMSYDQTLAVTFVFAITTSMVSPLFTDTYSELVTVITPDSRERAKIYSINSIIYSAAPSLTQLFVPILSNLTGGYTNINTYKYIVVPIGLVGVSMNLFTAFNCRERTVVSKKYVQKVNVFEGVKEIFKNKYWWLRSLSGQIGFMEGAAGALLGWIYVYGVQNMTQYGLVMTVLGTASLISMSVCPILLRKLGNRRLLILHNSMNIVLLVGYTLTFKVPTLLLVFMYVNNMFNNLSIVYDGVMHSEVKDYQQYLSGRRMDFTFGTAGLVFMPLGMLTGLFIPFVYERFGLTTNYDILYDPVIRNGLFVVLCYISVIGAAINLVPFFFYGLSREKHRNYIKVLRYRAMLDDYDSGDISPQLVKEVVEGVREGYEYINAPEPDITQLKNELAAAKALPKGDERAKAVKGAKLALENAKNLPERRKCAETILIKEINKYDAPQMKVQAEKARELVEMGIENLRHIDKEVLKKAKELSAETKEEKAFRRQSIKRAGKLIKMAEMIRKNYPNEIVVPDQAEIDEAVAMPSNNRAQSSARSKAIKEAEQKHQLYHKTFRPYLEAELLVRRFDLSKVVYAKVEEKYDDAVRELEEAAGNS